MGFNPTRLESRRDEAFPTRAVTIGEQPTPKREVLTWRMSDAEWKLRREKGLCFRCDERYTVGHQCKNREMRVLLVQEEEDSEVERGDLPVMEQVEAVVEKIKLSLNSVVGLVTPGTMKLKGRVGELTVTVLIDCGATHNFIALGLV